jgi:hypothetical protein
LLSPRRLISGQEEGALDAGIGDLRDFDRARHDAWLRKRRTMRRVLRQVTPIGVALTLVLSACSSDPQITAAFTSRMQTVDEARTSVENRVITLNADCQLNRVRETPYCFNGRNWYADNVQAAFNGWIAAVESDLTDSRSLENIESHDPRLQRALANAKAFSKWVDELHVAAQNQQQSTSQGAMGAPTIEKLIPPIAEAAGTIWQQYQEGETAKVEALKSQIDNERFASFSDIASR